MALRQQQPARTVVGVPISAPDTCREFQAEADEIVGAETPRPFLSFGMRYYNFQQTTDEEVRFATCSNRLQIGISHQPQALSRGDVPLLFVLGACQVSVPLFGQAGINAVVARYQVW